MELTREFIERSYRLFLGRAPENEQIIHEHLTQHNNVFHFLKSIIDSDEFKLKNFQYIKHHDYRGYRNEEIQLIQKYHDPNRSIIPNCLVDYFGTVTSKHFLPAAVQNMAESLEGIPMPMNFLSEAAEWLGVLESIDSNQGKFIGLELGAGWAPWSVLCGVLCTRIDVPYELYPVEAELGKTQFIEENITLNHLNPQNFNIINAVVGDEDKYIDFPILKDASNDYGLSVDKKSMSKRQAVVGFRKTQQLTIKSLIKNINKVDLIHVDIQGFEYRAILHSIKAINKKVRYLVIGTHSRKIEGDLFELLWNNKWILVREKPCLFDPEISLEANVDGIQVWKNKRLVQ